MKITLINLGYSPYSSKQARAPCGSPPKIQGTPAMTIRQRRFVNQREIKHFQMMLSDVFILSLPNQERNSGSGAQQSTKPRDTLSPTTHTHMHAYKLLNNRKFPSIPYLEVLATGNSYLPEHKSIATFRRTILFDIIFIIFISQPYYK